MNISNSNVDKYYILQKRSMVFLTLVLENKPAKFELKAKLYIFSCYLFIYKKDRHISHTRFGFHSKNSKIKYTVKLSKKNTRDLQINSKESTSFFRIL